MDRLSTKAISDYVSPTFPFMLLADDFIRSDLQENMVPLGIEPWTFCSLLLRQPCKAAHIDCGCLWKKKKTQLFIIEQCDRYMSKWSTASSHRSSVKCHILCRITEQSILCPGHTGWWNTMDGGFGKGYIYVCVCLIYKFECHAG